MVARCGCGLVWNISIKTDLSEPYVCPECEAKQIKKIAEPVKYKKKNKGRVSSVLQRNREKYSISNS